MPLPDKKHTIADDIIVTNHTMMPDANEDSYISPLKKIFSVTADLLKSTTTQTPGGEATTFSAIKKEELFLASRILARAHIQHNLLFLPSSLARAKNGYVFRLDTLKEDIPVEYNYLYFF